MSNPIRTRISARTGNGSVRLGDAVGDIVASNPWHMASGAACHRRVEPSISVKGKETVPTAQPGKSLSR